MSDSASPLPHAEIVTFQLACAFGQGAQMFIDGDAVAVLLQRYNNAIASLPPEQWRSQALQALEWARAIGRLSAHAALARGQAHIAPDDVLAAVGAVDRIKIAAFGRCPYC